MTRKAFGLLSEERKRKKVLEQAVYLTSRQTHDMSVFLFQLDGFYVEVYFLNDNEEMYSIHSFDDPELLRPYLDRIDIQPLLEYLQN